ncbi:hypothetical protein H8356DRAFT_1324672 [Neocallimastix lanati (nom. inval.)]|nr:hypothetical protein H8356DRAFT_1324672 [Neocallimastix sp. JGI-2020a]
MEKIFHRSSRYYGTSIDNAGGTELLNSMIISSELKYAIQFSTMQNFKSLHSVSTKFSKCVISANHKFNAPNIPIHNSQKKKNSIHGYGLAQTNQGVVNPEKGRVKKDREKTIISFREPNSNPNPNIDLHIWVPISHMAIQLLINCKLRRSQSSLHTARRCIPNVPTYISNDHEHQNGTINSSLVGVIIGDWKFYNHQGLCFNSKRSIRVGLMDITCGLMISQDRNLIRLFVTCILIWR